MDKISTLRAEWMFKKTPLSEILLFLKASGFNMLDISPNQM